MSHERARTSMTHRPMLRITDDDGDRLVVVKHEPVQDRMSVECVSAYTRNAVSVSLTKSDARALRRFLNEFLHGDDGDDDEV